LQFGNAAVDREQTGGSRHLHSGAGANEPARHVSGLEQRPFFLQREGTSRNPRRRHFESRRAVCSMHASLYSLSARAAVAQAPAYRRASTQTAPRRSATTVAMSFHDLSAKDIDGNDVAFSKFKGKVVLVTNVASR
jgi:hypothetical protein